MAAGKYSFTIEQGTTVDFEIQYTDVNGEPVDLTGYSGKMQIKSAFADDKPVVYATLSSSLLPDGTGLNFSGSSGTLPPTSGSIGIYIASCTSYLFTFHKGKYDLELSIGSGSCPVVTRILEGVVAISKEVTR